MTQSILNIWGENIELFWICFVVWSLILRYPETMSNLTVPEFLEALPSLDDEIKIKMENAIKQGKVNLQGTIFIKKF